MPVPSNNSGLRDNHTRGSVADFLKAKIRTESELSVVSAYFTIYAYDALKDYLGTIDHLDFLFGEPSFIGGLDPNKTGQKAFIIDANGLDDLDRRLLGIIKTHYSGGPVGVEALAATLNEEADTIVDVVEPFLLKAGFLRRTGRGRELTEAGRKML